MSSRDLVTCSGLSKVGATGCLELGTWLRVWGVVGVDGEGWGCWCAGSVNCARGVALNGASGSGEWVVVVVVVDVDVNVGVVVRHARKMVVDGVCSKGRARAFRKADRANMVSSRSCSYLWFSTAQIERVGCNGCGAKSRSRRVRFGREIECASGRVGDRSHVTGQIRSCDLSLPRPAAATTFFASTR